MSVAEKLLDLQAARVSIKNAIQARGVPVPAGATLADYAYLILLIDGEASPIVPPGNALPARFPMTF